MYTDAEALVWREEMVASQLAGRGIRDQRVLAAMMHVPRHRFCTPDTPLADAYGDHPQPLGRGQTISQPWMVAAMAAALELAGSERVLEIGTGSGYGAAVLGCLAATVHTVERLPELAEAARVRLAALALARVPAGAGQGLAALEEICEPACVLVHVGDGSLGLAEFAPYDAICVTAAAPAVPEPLLQQLAEGGRLVIPVGSRDIQELLVIRRHGKQYRRTPHGGCRFVPLLGTHGW